MYYLWLGFVAVERSGASLNHEGAAAPPARALADAVLGRRCFCEINLTLKMHRKSSRSFYENTKPIT